MFINTSLSFPLFQVSTQEEANMIPPGLFSSTSWPAMMFQEDVDPQVSAEHQWPWRQAGNTKLLVISLQPFVKSDKDKYKEVGVLLQIYLFYTYI